MYLPKGFNRRALNSEENDLFRQEEQRLLTPTENLTTMKGSFLSCHETDFLEFLKTGYKDHVFPQVQLIRVIEVDIAKLEEDWLNWGSAWWERPGKSDIFMQISMLSLDYVLCDAQYQVKSVIELDGPEHDYAPEPLEATIKLRNVEYKTLTGDDKTMVDRVRLWSRDRIKEAAIKGAGLRFIRVKNDELLDKPKLNTRLQSQGVF